MPFLVLHREGPAHAAGSGSLVFGDRELGKARLRFRGSNMWPLPGCAVRWYEAMCAWNECLVALDPAAGSPRAAPSAVFVVALLLFAAR